MNLQLTRTLSNAIGVLFFAVSFACSNERPDYPNVDNAVLSEVTPSAVEQKDKWPVVRLSPQDFVELPQNLKDALENRGCLIPQVFDTKKKHNVISGEFSRNGKKDWAALCSKNEVTSILVFWEGSETSVSDIFSAPESAYMQDMVGDGTMGFSRAIDTVGKDYIISHYKEYGGTKPPKIEHDGINDAFVEKASTVLYFHQGKWMELQGAD